jgi:hypothetical protein
VLAIQPGSGTCANENCTIMVLIHNEKCVRQAYI